MGTRSTGSCVIRSLERGFRVRIGPIKKIIGKKKTNRKWSGARERAPELFFDLARISKWALYIYNTHSVSTVRLESYHVYLNSVRYRRTDKFVLSVYSFISKV